MQSFTRDQLIDVVEMILTAAVDAIERGMPITITAAERIRLADGPDGIGPLSRYEDHLLDSIADVLCGIYARLNSDSIDDSLAAAGNFREAVALWVATAWSDFGEYVRRRLHELDDTGPFWHAYIGYPDCRKHATFFVENYFAAYLENSD